MNHIAPVLAADLWEGLIPLVLLVIWVLSQVLGNRNRAAPPQKDAPQQPRGAPKNISDEIEAFLRQVAKQRGAEPAEEIELLEPELVAEEPSVTARAPVQLEPVEVELVHEGLAPVLPSRAEVSAHVKGHIGGSSFAEEVSHLGEEVDQAEEMVEERIHEKFDHEVGRLAHVAATRADAAFDRQDAGVWGDAPTEATAAARSPLSAVFKDLDSIRQAIILSEILRPPTERW